MGILNSYFSISKGFISVTVISLRHKQKAIPKYPYLTTVFGVVFDRTVHFIMNLMYVCPCVVV